MNPRHQKDTKTFAQLTFEEQAKAMNMTALQFRKQLNAHLRRAEEESRHRREVLSTRLNLLQNILDTYSDQVREPAISIQFGKGSGLQPPSSNTPMSELPTTQSPCDTFMCSHCQVRRSIKEANMSADGLSFICDSCYLSNPPKSGVDSTLDEIR